MLFCFKGNWKEHETYLVPIVGWLALDLFERLNTFGIIPVVEGWDKGTYQETGGEATGTPE